MKSVATRALGIFALIAFAGAAVAQSAKPEDSIRLRKAGFSFMAWNMGQIKANLGGDFNKGEVLAAANVVAATANSGLFTTLFPAGTEKNVAGEKTRVNADWFSQPDKAREAHVAFAKEANELAMVAATGDVAAIKSQFGNTGGSCKNCHDDFRND